MAQPATFTGEAEDCNRFILQCLLYFEMQSQQFSNDRARVAFVISLLSGKALQWAQSLWNSNAQRLSAPFHPPFHLSPFPHQNLCKSTHIISFMRSVKEGSSTSCPCIVGEKDTFLPPFPFNHHGQRPTARLRAKSRKSGGTCGPIATSTKTAGADSSPGRNMPRIPSGNSLCPVNHRRFQLSVIGSKRARGCGIVGLQQAVRRHKRHADTRRAPTPQFQPGQKVWLSTRNIRLHLPCQKLSPRYVGPFTVQRQINEVTYSLNLPPQYRISPSFQVSLLKPFTDPLSSPLTGSGGDEVPSPPELVDKEVIYRVHSILDSRRRGNQLEYLIDWEGYGPEEQSWVARDDYLDPSLLTQFHADHPNHPAPRGRGRPRRHTFRASGAAVEEGVLSRRHNHPIHQSAHHHQILSLVHSPRDSDSPHLHLLINAPYLNLHNLHSSIWSCHSHVQTSTCYLPVDLPDSLYPVSRHLSSVFRSVPSVLLSSLPVYHLQEKAQLFLS
ncbi:Retrotransposon-like protein 1 [Anabarilius grahami]|uniref:Retrotransposon-like protein 1 n=1 Tax=Anabarilius grahami TaxID=495550 RepID=A0A3N0YXN7_ANAGA|nr:Retrotransposon-like protein 1 [Anabarilius grahami]